MLWKTSDFAFSFGLLRQGLTAEASLDDVI